jgi:hypothetical protein
LVPPLALFLFQRLQLFSELIHANFVVRW